MRVYIAASWRQRTRVRELAHALRERGFEAYDFTERSACCPEDNPTQFRPDADDYAEYMTSYPAWQATQDRNRVAMEQADIVVLLLPAGNDSHWDAGYAMGRGARGYVVGHPCAGDRSPVHLNFGAIFHDDAELLTYLAKAYPLLSKLTEMRRARAAATA